MRYQITHTTTYIYDRPVTLAPHFLRLRPRCDVNQKLHAFSLTLDPPPKQLSENVDLDGNAVVKAWFTDEPLATLTVNACSQVETLCENPFVYLLEPWAINLPIDYSASLLGQLQPYLGGQRTSDPVAIDPVAIELAQDLWQASQGNTIDFLSKLNQTIYSECGYLLRETGAALPAGITWRTKQGSCRDYAVLFMEVCRAMGIAARFVSGYQEGDLDSTDRHLHAWAEAYLPGAGWRGYDPTHGLAVADRHIPLVASPNAKHTVPISGTLKQGIGAQSEMTYQLRIEAI
ncbi:transglutaminase family protein [Phormidium tenue FACHB-886]|nr:transglutaminase family protein [Phormidium tenue FACHB-886]